MKDRTVLWNWYMSYSVLIVSRVRRGNFSILNLGPKLIYFGALNTYRYKSWELFLLYCLSQQIFAPSLKQYNRKDAYKDRCFVKNSKNPFFNQKQLGCSRKCTRCHLQNSNFTTIKCDSVKLNINTINPKKRIIGFVLTVTVTRHYSNTEKISASVLNFLYLSVDDSQGRRY